MKFSYVAKLQKSKEEFRNASPNVYIRSGKNKRYTLTKLLTVIYFNVNRYIRELNVKLKPRVSRDWTLEKISIRSDAKSRYWEEWRKKCIASSSCTLINYRKRKKESPADTSKYIYRVPRASSLEFVYVLSIRRWIIDALGVLFMLMYVRRRIESAILAGHHDVECKVFLASLFPVTARSSAI